jgi:hypothetical protein
LFVLFVWFSERQPTKCASSSLITGGRNTWPIYRHKYQDGANLEKNSRGTFMGF